ncbi:MAG: pyridoxal-dependent decarboxylase [Gemmatimonadota bacterium]|nr:pyridoxal-dependent decarboxylase [Gemmatimonadota bacterium]MDH3367727.1 pyridoxal-dependent decarboxylase [Gemmatimonadota bacterium]MDH3477528.1 pyridoxal-dependent decarboxylase [Gemmatimonadota bacterium]MDH3570472.1 pyridoxal-dependent decarboxylase [Gemmatimonadota bacterium]MDH5549171.1 pyridoxal-dependent decarboxylase [Gemmatimonadota bacterium]
MTPEEFRAAGHAVIDWVAHYLEMLEQYPVLAQVEPGAIRDRLPDTPPSEGEPLEAILADLDTIILPGITHWQSPRFFGYFPANASPPAILGDLVSSGLGVQGMLWSTSPACTELETHVLDWLVDLLGLPPAFRSSASGGGVIQDTASSATLCAMLAARERTTDFATNRHGVDRPLTAYASSQAHSSVEKAIAIAGVGKDRLRLIEVDDHFAMRPDMLERAIRADLDAGLTPFFVCATVGTTSVTAIDPVAAIGTICRHHGLWLHVDAALAGSAAICPEFRWVHDGVELADSYCFNPHKWLLTNFDCDCLYVADREPLIKALSVVPEYLRNVATESGAVFDYRDWHVPLGRRFRALKLWFVLRHYGVAGLQRHIRHHVQLARTVADWVRDDPAFELVAPVPLNLVCFRHRGDDAFNEALLSRLNASGELFLTHTKLGGRLVLRLAIGGTYTEQRHVQAAWDTIRASARALSG